MKKQSSSQRKPKTDHMRAEYDFNAMKGGVRGKHYKAYRRGHSVIIHKSNGTTIVQHFRLEDGAVVLDPRVRKYFHNSEQVNKALRGLIELMPKQRRTKASS